MNPDIAPIVVGVTGHRDLRRPDVAELEKRVREFFATLRYRHPDAPIVVLSALAEGADRLAARVALALNLRLQAPLPMPRDLYELDFDENSKEDFAGLLSRAESYSEIPMHKPDAGRIKQYDLLGDLLAQSSTILLALWDGAPSDKPGGTAAVVEKVRKRAGGKVYHIVTPRESNPAPPHALAAGWLETRQAALCLFRRGDTFLITDLTDPVTGAALHRPPGGGLEDGETPEQAVRRELLEELGIRLTGVQPLGAIDHIWYWKGRELHERAWLFAASPADDPRLDRGETPELIEADGDRIQTCWRACGTPGADLPPLCPPGLLELLRNFPT